MTFQSTVASVQNIRKQRQLELELVELDRQWNIELKFIARERLGVLKELCRINQDMRELDHFKETMHGKAITRFADRLHGRLQQDREIKQLVHKFDFEPDPVEKMNLSSLLLRDEGDGEEGVGPIEGEDIAKVWTSKDLNKQRVQLQKTTFEQGVAERRNRRRAFVDKAVLGSRKKKNFQRDRNGFIRNLGGSGDAGGGAGRVLVGAFGPPLESNSSSSAADEVDTETPSAESSGGGQGGEGGEGEMAVYNGESSPESGDDPIQHGQENGDTETAAGPPPLLVPAPPEEEYNGPRRPYGPFKFPSLPALNNLRKIDTIKVRGQGRGRRRRERIHPSLSDRNSASLDYLPLIKGTRGQHGVFTSPLEKTDSSNGKTTTLPEVTKPNPGIGLPTITET